MTAPVMKMKKKAPMLMMEKLKVRISRLLSHIFNASLVWMKPLANSLALSNYFLFFHFWLLAVSFKTTYSNSNSTITAIIPMRDSTVLYAMLHNKLVHEKGW
jgi:hypothetical protein